jgi:hypothetical protein
VESPRSPLYIQTNSLCARLHLELYSVRIGRNYYVSIPTSAGHSLFNSMWFAYGLLAIHRSTYFFAKN